MDTINDNICQLLEMLDNPDAYTEQEICDIINRDEDTRDTYRLMVEAKRSCRHRQKHTAVDVEAAWQRFNQKLQSERHGTGRMKMLSMVRRHSRVAAMFISVLMLSGIAYAAMQFISSSQRQEGKNQTEATQVVDKHQQASPQVQPDSTARQTRVFENAELSAMLSEMAAYYHFNVVYQNEQARHIRLYFTWNRQQGIDEVIETFNRFERIHIEKENQQLIVR